MSISEEERERLYGIPPHVGEVWCFRSAAGTFSDLARVIEVTETTIRWYPLTWSGHEWVELPQAVALMHRVLWAYARRAGEVWLADWWTVDRGPAQPAEGGVRR